MDLSKKKQIIFAVICLVGAIAISVLFYNPFGGTSSSLKKPVQMLCVNCNTGFEISSNEYTKLMTKKGAIGPMGPTGPPPGLTCPKCGQGEAYTAAKCKKCGNIFFPDPTISADFQDRCPECGYSAREEKHKSR